MESFWISNFLPIIIIALLLWLYFVVKNLLPSYFSEKGKNVATKQDISEITKLVEDVKFSFAKETESLKANLQVITNIQVGIASEERNSIIDYHQKFFRFLNLLLDSSMNGVDTYDSSELDNFNKLCNKTYQDFLDSETKFKLFVENEELQELATEIKLDILAGLVHRAPYCINALKNNNLAFERIKHESDSASLVEKRKELFRQRSDVHQKFRDSILTDYKNLLPKIKDFQSGSRKMIYNLLDK